MGYRHVRRIGSCAQGAWCIIHARANNRTCNFIRRVMKLQWEEGDVDRLARAFDISQGPGFAISIMLLYGYRDFTLPKSYVMACSRHETSNA